MSANAARCAYMPQPEFALNFRWDRSASRSPDLPGAENALILKLVVFSLMALFGAGGVATWGGYWRFRSVFHGVMQAMLVRQKGFGMLDATFSVVKPPNQSLMEMKRMSRFFKLAGLPVLAIALTFVTSSGAEADAGGFSISIGNYGYRGYGGHHSLRPSYGPSIYYGRSFRPSYNYSRTYYHSGHHAGHHGGYHHPRRPHYDYHAPTLVPHGNHYDYVPGHWDFHHRGHIHH